MNLFQSSQDRDLDLLSAFIDNELSANERAQLERRLKAEPHLRATLADLRGVHTRLADLPKVKVPRSFTLKPEMVGQKSRPRSNLIPIFNYASVLAATLFAVLIGAELATGVQPMAAPESTSTLMVAQAPVADAQIAIENVTQSPDAEALDTQSAEIGITALTITESPNEPLTGGGGQGGGGGGQGGGDGTGAAGNTMVSPSDPAPPESTATVEETADLFYASGTPDDSLRITAETQTPPSEAPTPKEVPAAEIAGDEDQANAAQPPLSPLRLGAYVAGAAFVLFLLGSLLLRRR
jgi:anti-sigma factor RsiW